MCCKAHATYFPELPYIEYVLYACSGRILYLSGTDLQDYLLEPQAGKAEGHRYTLLETRKDMDAALQHHLQLLSSAEAQPFQVLTQELGEYWCVLEPTFEWTAERRQRAGYAFLRDEVFPRRTPMLAIADQIGRLNEAQLNSGKVALQGAFRQFRSRLIITVGLTIALGLVLAVFSTLKILRLEGTSLKGSERSTFWQLVLYGHAYSTFGSKLLFLQ